MIKINVPTGSVLVCVDLLGAEQADPTKLAVMGFDVVDASSSFVMQALMAGEPSSLQYGGRSTVLRIVPQATVDAFEALEQRHAQERTDALQAFLDSARVELAVSVVDAPAAATTPTPTTP
jgi:hypothetical protein